MAAGAYVYLERDAARSAYLMRAGLIRISVVWRDGREFTHRLARPGDLFGETGLGAPEYGEHACALEASEIVEIPAAELATQFAHDPGNTMAVLKDLALRLAEARQAAAHLAFATTLERLCLVLQRLASEFGEPDGQLTKIPHYVKQEDVARLTGARREVVSGLLNRLREEGVISYSRKGTLQVDLGALERHLQTFRLQGRSR